MPDGQQRATSHPTVLASRCPSTLDGGLARALWIAFHDAVERALADDRRAQWTDHHRRSRSRGQSGDPSVPNDPSRAATMKPRLPVTRGYAAERSERRKPIARCEAMASAAELIARAVALNVQLEARPGGLWADKVAALPLELRDSLARNRPAVLRLLRHGVALSGPLTLPSDWCDGVALLATRPAPSIIPARRWAVLAASAARMVRDHGAELHATGWDALDLFGAARCRARRQPGWLGAGMAARRGGERAGCFGRCSDHVCGAGRGARLVCQRRERARAGAVLAWELQGGRGGSQA